MTVSLSYALRFLIVTSIGLLAVTTTAATLAYGRLIRKRCLRIRRRTVR